MDVHCLTATGIALLLSLTRAHGRPERPSASKRIEYDECVKAASLWRGGVSGAYAITYRTPRRFARLFNLLSEGATSEGT